MSINHPLQVPGPDAEGGPISVQVREFCADDIRNYLRRMEVKSVDQPDASAPDALDRYIDEITSVDGVSISHLLDFTDCDRNTLERMSREGLRQIVSSVKAHNPAFIRHLEHVGRVQELVLKQAIDDTAARVSSWLSPP